MTTLQQLLHEDTPLQPTKASSRQSWWFLASVMIGCTICVPVFVMGAQLSQQLSFYTFIAAALIGGSFAAAIASATGIVGQRTGLPTAMLAKIAFGTQGYILANVVMSIGAVGWFGIQTSIFSESFVKLAAQVWGLNFNLTAVTIIAGLLMSTTAVIGFRGLGKLSYLATPLLTVLLCAPMVILYGQGQFTGLTAHTPTNPITLGTAIAIIAGAYSFACTMPDVTRFMASASHTVKGAFANFVLAYPLLLILTGSVALAAHNGDFMQIMLNLGFGSLAIIVLFLATWTTNDTNAYAGALCANLFLPTIPRWKLAAAIGAFGTICAVWGIFDHFMTWLIFSGNIYAPMAGVYVADYWLNPQRYTKLTGIPAYRSNQLAAWLGGLAIGLCTTSTENMGAGLLTLTTIPMLDALLAAACIQLLLHKLYSKK